MPSDRDRYLLSTPRPSRVGITTKSSFRRTLRCTVPGMPAARSVVFFAAEPPLGVLQARIDSAVLPVWPGGGTSPLNSVVTVSVPRGTRVYAGEVSTQGGVYVGGGRQVFIDHPWAQGVTVTGVGPLR